MIPKWTEYGRSFDDFQNDGLNQPGTLIQLATGEERLIGDINPLGGVCDDCQDHALDYRGSAIVAAYAIVYTRSAA